MATKNQKSATVTETAPETSAKKANKKTTAPQVEVEAPEAEESDELPLCETHEVYEVECDTIKMNSSRGKDGPSPERVAELARSIESVGLINPIVLGADYKIVAGNSRLAAFMHLGRKTIPARFAIDKNGDAVKADDAVFATFAENLARSSPPVTLLARQFAKVIESGTVKNAAALAKSIGVSAPVVSKVLAIKDATKALREALDAGIVTIEAATAIINRGKSPSEQDALLESLIAASNGKRISAATVEKSSKGGAKTRTASGKRAGRKPSKVELDEQALATEKSGITGMLRKEGDGYTVTFNVALVYSGNSFAKFDFADRISAAVKSLDGKAVRSELENARKMLAEG